MDFCIDTMSCIETIDCIERICCIETIYCIEIICCIGRIYYENCWLHNVLYDFLGKTNWT